LKEDVSKTSSPSSQFELQGCQCLLLSNNTAAAAASPPKFQILKAPAQEKLQRDGQPCHYLLTIHGIERQQRESSQ